MPNQEKQENGKPLSRLKRIRQRFQRSNEQRHSAVEQIKRKPIQDWISGKTFSYVHGNNLVYNCCWEDPRLDRVALNIGQDDRILVITSAGCNALDYALLGPAKINAVDMNPRQNALLDLKIAAIKELEFDDFFRMFGDGRLPEFQTLLKTKFRPHLNEWAYKYWTKHHNFFDGKRSFFFHGSSGSVARMVNLYIDHYAKIRPELDLLLAAKTLEEQTVIYERSVKEHFWSGLIKKFLGSGLTLSMLGVPRAQRQQVELHYENGITTFMEDCLESVFTKLPISDNYFWRAYINGCYTRECCPEYLKRENFYALKGGLVNCIQTHTCTIEAFLRGTNEKISRYILLDHMDWLSTFKYKALESEWQSIVDTAAPNTKIIYRSGGTKVEYVEPIEVLVNGNKVRMGDVLNYHQELAKELHQKDRVHTYGCFYIADLQLPSA